MKKQEPIFNARSVRCLTLRYDDALHGPRHLELTEWDNGEGMTLSVDGGFVNLYHEDIPHLRKLLKRAAAEAPDEEV